jgi:large subunit ribosomal protein L31e
MAETKQTQVKTLEKEYVIPLRREWSKGAKYKRTSRSVKAIKNFIVKHMNVRDKDLSKVKLDVYLNNELWFRGAKKPFNKIKVKSRKEGDVVKVSLVEEFGAIKFAKAKDEKRHKKVEKRKEEPKKDEEKKEDLEGKVEGEKSEEEKKEEKEKAKSVEKAQEKIVEQDVKAQKHITKVKEPTAFRKALKK